MERSKDLICKCGHLKSVHNLDDAFYKDLCKDCAFIWKTDMTDIVRYKDASHRFQPDNLKYLENLSE